MVGGYEDVDIKVCTRIFLYFSFLLVLSCGMVLS